MIETHRDGVPLRRGAGSDDTGLTCIWTDRSRKTLYEHRVSGRLHAHALPGVAKEPLGPNEGSAACAAGLDRSPTVCRLESVWLWDSARAGDRKPWTYPDHPTIVILAMLPMRSIHYGSLDRQYPPGHWPVVAGVSSTTIGQERERFPPFPLSTRDRIAHQSADPRDHPHAA